MAKPFDPKHVLRQTSNHLLQDLFETHHHDLDLPWDQLEETEVEPIFNAWQALPEPDCRAIEIILHEVSDMAHGDQGVQVICEEAIRQDNQDLIDELEQYESRHDKALWTAIRGADVWNLAVRFARADNLAHGRYWIKRCDIPANTPSTNSKTLRVFEKALAAFFLASQARGRHCKVEHYTRANGANYFFAYLDDYADTYVTLDGDGQFARRPERRAFELVMVYDRAHGTLEMYVQGGKKIYIPLQEIFCRVILHSEIGPENRNSHPYNLNGLLNRDIQFPTDPADGITEVRVRKLRLAVKGQPRRRITLEADPDGEVDSIYDMLELDLDQGRLPNSILNVTQVGLSFSFDKSILELPKSLSFEVSYPNSSNLRSKPEAVRELAQKYLRQWGLDRAADTRNINAASSAGATRSRGQRSRKS